jgi:hypothetical protein
VVVLAAVWSLGVGSSAWAAEPECRAARKHFRKSIWWFETDRWDQAVEEAEQALSKARGCEPDELAFVVPYGRWRYTFIPEVYLGVAAANASWCEGEGIEDAECRVDGALWSLSAPCEREYLRTGGEICTETEGEDPRCDPEVDWWLRLARSGVAAEIDPLATEDEVRLIRDPARGDRRLRDDCAELWSVAPFLVEAILRRENKNRVACEALVTELTALLAGARLSCHAAG